MSTSIPTAIIVGMTIMGTLLSAAVYFGLRSRGEASVAPLASAREDRASVIESSAPVAVPAPARPDGQAAIGEVTTELEAMRAELVAKCWQPAVAKTATPSTAQLAFDLTFDPTGHESARGLLEDHATARPDVTFCVQTRVPQLHIAAQGASVHVRVPFSLPR